MYEKLTTGIMMTMEKSKLTLQKNMRELRKERGWIQEELAEKAGYTVGFIADIERGKSWVSPESLEAIREAFGVPLERLFHTGTAPAPLTMPVSKTLLKMLSIPDQIYDLAAKFDNKDDVWESVKVILMDAEKDLAKKKQEKG